MFPDGKIFVSGRAEDDQAMQWVEVAIVNAAGQYMSSSGTFTSTNASWRTAFLNSPGTPGSNFSYTTPVIPAGAYTVRVRAIDQHDFVSVIYERHATVTQPPNNPPVASFTTSCVQNVLHLRRPRVDRRERADADVLVELRQRQRLRPGPDPDIHQRQHLHGHPDRAGRVGRHGDRHHDGDHRRADEQPPPNPVINPPACSNLTCNFSAVGSDDPNTGDTITYRWDWGDGDAGQHLDVAVPHLPGGGHLHGDADGHGWLGQGDRGHQKRDGRYAIAEGERRGLRPRRSPRARPRR